MATTGDGLTSLGIARLMRFRARGKQMTRTTPRPLSCYAVQDLVEDVQVTQYDEKAQADRVSDDLFVLGSRVRDYYSLRDLPELEPLANPAANGPRTAFRHEAHRSDMDGCRKWEVLDRISDSEDAPWQAWQTLIA
jgi:hypothetical protein